MAAVLTLWQLANRKGSTLEALHSYLTSVLDPNVLPPYVVADINRLGWRIEDTCNTVKRLLGLSYLWTGSINGIQLQIWATWLFYTVLVDLADAVGKQQFHFTRDATFHQLCYVRSLDLSLKGILCENKQKECNCVYQ